MSGVDSKRENTEHFFIFHGKAGEFFIICLVNVLLTIMTLGIYFPWALVRTRRYIYENMALDGMRFNYNAKGSAFFLSWLLIALSVLVVFLTIGILGELAGAPGHLLGMVLLLAFFFLLPLMMVKGLRYQATMSSLNNVRFGFTCSGGKAIWNLLGLPILMSIAVIMLAGGISVVLPEPESLSGVFILVLLGVITELLVIGTINGIIYGKWMALLGKGASFGIHSFDIQVSLKHCARIFIAGMLIALPFFVVAFIHLGALFTDIVMTYATGRMDENVQLALASKYGGQIFMSNLLFLAGVVLCMVFILTKLRNLFINGLRLGDTLTFRSTVTVTGTLWQIVVLLLASLFTFGLAYPWARIRYIRYLAQHTCVVGHLEAVELTDSAEPEDKGFFTLISRGLMPGIPFV